jgi:hypothetical protein
MPYLLRVELPDVPGSLGRVASAIGEAGGDIEAIEIVEHRHDGTAVDDVLLETAPGVMPDSLVSACNQLDGVHVLWVSRYGAGGNLFLDLEAVESMTQDPARAIVTLVDALPEVFRVDWGVVMTREGDGAKITHGTPAAPSEVPHGVSWPANLEKASVIEVPAEWSELVVAASPLTADEVIVVGRRGGPDFQDSEIARLAHLVAMAASLRRNA